MTNHHPKTVAIIQARMASSRLPGKVLLDLGGQPMLARVVERTRRASLVDQVVVATTSDPSDDPVEAFCRQRAYDCARGSLHDVLDRYYQAARQAGADIVVRITADCPVIDPGVIDKTIAAFLNAENLDQPDNAEHLCDFAANRLPPPWGRTYPIGLDVEVCSFAGLETAWKQAVLPHQREHVMPFFYENPQRFRILLVNHEMDYGALRWTVDTPADLELLRNIYARFANRDDFSWLDVLALFEREPALAQINASVQHKHYQAVDERYTPGK
jgi:spore coat polysaccharide biosynthesis protein SpsF